jgi:hypothetical protein
VDADLDLVPDAADRSKRKQPGRAAEAASPELRSQSGLRRRAEPDTFLAGLGAVAGDGDWDREGFRSLDAEDVVLDDGLAMAAAEDGMAVWDVRGLGTATAASGVGQKGRGIAVGGWEGGEWRKTRTV